MGQKLANQLNRGETKKITTSGAKETLSGDGVSDVRKIKSTFQFVELIWVLETS